MPVERNLFDNTNVEFPKYCRTMWSKSQEASVARTAGKMLPCWIEAGGDKNATFITLAYLDAT